MDDLGLTIATVLASTLLIAVTWVCTRRWMCNRPRPTPRVSISRLIAFLSPFTLRPVSGWVPPIETFLSAKSLDVV